MGPQFQVTSLNVTGQAVRSSEIADTLVALPRSMMLVDALGVSLQTSARGKFLLALLTIVSLCFLDFAMVQLTVNGQGTLAGEFSFADFALENCHRSNFIVCS